MSRTGVEYVYDLFAQHIDACAECRELCADGLSEDGPDFEQLTLHVYENLTETERLIGDAIAAADGAQN
jgi:hypothetical protein